MNDTGQKIMVPCRYGKVRVWVNEKFALSIYREYRIIHAYPCGN